MVYASTGSSSSELSLPMVSFGALSTSKPSDSLDSFFGFSGEAGLVAAFSSNFFSSLAVVLDCLLLNSKHHLSGTNLMRKSTGNTEIPIAKQINH